LAALARGVGAAVVPELDARGAPPTAAASAAWFVEAHAGRWARARALADAAPLVVLDGDPLKGLWYGPAYPDAGWPGLDVVAPLHEAAVARGALGFPDLYALLTADEPELRARRAGDPTRTRRHFESHLRLVEPQRRHFAALGAEAPGRVLVLPTEDRDALPRIVRDAAATLPPGPPDAAPLLARLLARLATRASGHPA
jgi:hypothetical protein